MSNIKNRVLLVFLTVFAHLLCSTQAAITSLDDLTPGTLVTLKSKDHGAYIHFQPGQGYFLSVLRDNPLPFKVKRDGNHVIFLLERSHIPASDPLMTALLKHEGNKEMLDSFFALNPTLQAGSMHALPLRKGGNAHEKMTIEFSGDGAYLKIADGSYAGQYVCAPSKTGYVMRDNGGQYSKSLFVIEPYMPLKDNLQQGESLFQGQFIEATNKSVKLIHQPDGNVVLYTQEGKPLWSSNTAGKSTKALVMQSDGNLVLYDQNGRPLWSSGTHGKAGASLKLNDDQSLIISHNNAVAWTGYKTPTPAPTHSSPVTQESDQKQVGDVVSTDTVWGVNALDKIYVRSGITSENPQGSGWDSVEGGLKQVSVNKRGRVWGVNAFDDIFVTADQGYWAHVGGKLRQVAAAGSNYMWGVNAGNQVFFRKGITAVNPQGSDWQHISEKLLKYVSVNSKGHVWATGIDDKVYFRDGVTASNPTGSNWREIGGLLTQLSVNDEGYLWGVNSNNDVFFRTGITSSNPSGDNWQHISGQKLTQISVAQQSVWAIGLNKDIYMRTGVTESNPQGTGWKKIDGSLKWVSSATMACARSLKQLPAGSIVALQSLKNNKYLQVDNGRHLKANAPHTGNKNALFEIVQDGTAMTLKQLVGAGNNLQSAPNSYEVRFENKNFLGWEKFIPEFQNDGTVFIKSEATGGYMSVREEDKVWTKDHTGGPSQKGAWEKFRVYIISAP